MWDSNYVKALVLNYHLPALLKDIGAFCLALFKKINLLHNEVENRIKQQQSNHSILLRTLQTIVYHHHGCNLFKRAILRSRSIYNIGVVQSQNKKLC